MEQARAYIYMQMAALHEACTVHKYVQSLTLDSIWRETARMLLRVVLLKTGNLK